MSEFEAEPGVPTEKWRMFIALPLPAALREELGRLLDRLRKAFQFTGCKASWVQADSMHLTLAFLGDLTPADAARVEALLPDAATGLRPLQLEVKGIGVFPDWRHPKVLWTGLRERTHQLEPLRARLVEGLRVAGIPLDDKPFKPHLTLARFRSLTGTAAAQNIAQAHRDFFVAAQPIDQIVLYRSELRPDGALHTPLAVQLLQPASTPA